MNNKDTIKDLIFASRETLISIILSYEKDKKRLINYLESLLTEDTLKNKFIVTSVCELIERIKSDNYD